MLPEILGYGGLILWLLIGLGAIAVLVFLERVLYYHREQINAAEFLNGVKNVLRRNNIVEALAICDATPGPFLYWPPLLRLLRYWGCLGPCWA